MLNRRVIHIIFSLALLIVVMLDVFTHVSLWIYIMIAGLYSAVEAYGSIVLSAEFFVPVKYHGEQNRGQIAITFDDGPLPGKTDRILDILKSHHVPATFFCIGHRVKDYPLLAKRIYEEGHVLGNHSYRHGKLFDLQSATAISRELTDTDDVIAAQIGTKPKFFRPPYGVTNPMVASAIRKGKYVTVGWSIRSFDTTIKDPARLMQRITKSIKGGDIFLFHDYSESMLQVLPAFLDHVTKSGLKIVRLDELLNENAYA
jgi:peptidoglycan/xylan/chitin deacetylase (PgdA/CDA1 family)